MSKFTLLILFVLIYFFESCQNKKDTVIDHRVFTSNEYKSRSPEQQRFFLDSVYACCIPTQNDSLTRNLLFGLSSEFYYLNEHHRSLQINRDLIRLASAAADTTALARANYYIGDSYETTSKDSAYHYYDKAEKLYLRIENYVEAARMKFNKGVLLFSDGNYVESEVEVSQALQLLERTTDQKLLFACYNLMGSNFEKLEDFPNAMKYYTKAKQVLASLSGTKGLDQQNNYTVTSTVNIANIYEKTGNYSRAISELESILDKDLKQNWPREYAVAVGNLGYVKMKSGMIIGVEELLLEALSISKKYDPNDQILYKLNNLGEFYTITGDTAKAMHYLNQSLRISEKANGGEEIKSTLKLLSRVDPVNDSKYKAKYIKFTDSLNKAQRYNRNKYARIEYETAQVENENKVLTTKNINIALGSMLVILCLLSLLIFRFLKSAKRELEVKKLQHFADEELHELLRQHQIQINSTKQSEQNRISTELHDGIMNRIYGVRLNLGMLNDREDAASKAKRLQFVDVLQEIEKEVRMISHDLHVETIYGQSDYISMLSDIVSQQNDVSSTKFIFTYDQDIDWNKISGLAKVTINRVLQEAISNVNKYANATECTIAVTDTSNELCLTIEDNGDGFNQKDANSGGIGLKNMRERAKAVNGKIHIDSNPGVGTKIVLTIAHSS